MTRKNLLWLVLAAGAGVALWSVAVANDDDERPRPPLPRWEYAQLLLEQGDPVFVQAERRSTVRPPTGRLSGAVLGGGRSETQYLLEHKKVRNVEVAALDLFGARGWQAVAVLPRDEGWMVLMRRQIPLR